MNIARGQGRGTTGWRISFSCCFSFSGRSFSLHSFFLDFISFFVWALDGVNPV